MIKRRFAWPRPRRSDGHHRAGTAKGIRFLMNVSATFLFEAGVFLHGHAISRTT
jgi:hypothetical protein